MKDSVTDDTRQSTECCCRVELAMHRSCRLSMYDAVQFNHPRTRYLYRGKSNIITIELPQKKTARFIGRFPVFKLTIILLRALRFHLNLLQFHPNLLRVLLYRRLQKVLLRKALLLPVPARDQVRGMQVQNRRPV